MPSYDLISEYGLDASSAGESISVSPYWVLAVVRFENPLTFSHRDQGSFSKLYEDAVRVRGNPLIITDNCIQVQTSSSKSSHLTTLNASLIASETYNYLSEIMPGDWLFCWMAHDEDTGRQIVKKIQDGQPCNGFHDGLKFMGRVNSLRKVIQQDSGIGSRQVRYTLNGVGFGEFDATLFYEPHLAEKIPAIGEYWARLGTTINKLISKGGGGVGVCETMLFMLDALLGQGIPKNLGRGNDDPHLRSTAGLDAPFSYIVPSVIGTIINKNDKSKAGGLLTAADLIEFVYGLQHYSGTVATDQGKVPGKIDTSEGLRLGQIFNPDGTHTGETRRWTGTDLMGTFLPHPPQFTDSSVWSVLNQYLNPATNELYTCLRANPYGDVVPTLVLRQLPFSTNFAPAGLETTKYLELPRWKVHSHLVRMADVGRSDSLRLNFIHVYGDIGPTKNNMYNGQVVRNPPIRDDLDIARSGLRNYSMTVSCHEKDLRNGGPGKWMALLADIVMGQQLALTGVIEMIGITAPICPGDNLEWDGTVFHIESVTHTGSIDASGRKEFKTTVSVSHGLAADPGVGQLGLYSGISAADQRTHEPAITQDGDPEPNRGQQAPAREAASQRSNGIGPKIREQE